MLSEEWEQLVCGQTDDASVANAANGEIKSRKKMYKVTHIIQGRINQL